MMISDQHKKDAQALCFAECKTGAFHDPENGCFGACASADKCEGWMPFVRTAREEQSE